MYKTEKGLRNYENCSNIIESHVEYVVKSLKEIAQVVTDVLHKSECPRKRFRVLNSKHVDSELHRRFEIIFDLIQISIANKTD